MIDCEHKFNLTKMTNADVIAHIDKAKEQKDLAFIEYVNQLTWGYKCELKREKPNHDQTKNENNN